MKNFLSFLFLGGLGYHLLSCPKCLCCGTLEQVTFWPRMTAYVWDGFGEGANADIPLCPDCGKEHMTDMQDMWDTYYSQLL